MQFVGKPVSVKCVSAHLFEYISKCKCLGGVTLYHLFKNWLYELDSLMLKDEIKIFCKLVSALTGAH